jgi:hypothetical protein
MCSEWVIYPLRSRVPTDGECAAYYLCSFFLCSCLLFDNANTRTRILFVRSETRAGKGNIDFSSPWLQGKLTNSGLPLFLSLSLASVPCIQAPETRTREKQRSPLKDRKQARTSRSHRLLPSRPSDHSLRRNMKERSSQLDDSHLPDRVAGPHNLPHFRRHISHTV